MGWYLDISQGLERFTWMQWMSHILLVIFFPGKNILTIWCFRKMESNIECWNWKKKRELMAVHQKRKCPKNAKLTRRRIWIKRKSQKKVLKWFAEKICLERLMKLFFSLEKCEFAAWSEWTVCDKNQKQRLRKVSLILYEILLRKNFIYQDFSIKFSHLLLTIYKIKSIGRTLTTQKICSFSANLQ